MLFAGHMIDLDHITYDQWWLRQLLIFFHNYLLFF